MLHKIKLQDGASVRSSRYRRALRHAIAIALIGAAGSAQAIAIQGNDWELDVGGIINAYYTATSCTGDNIGGIALGGRALGCGGENNKTTIGNGLLPSGLITKFKTTQDGIDVGGTIGIMVHTATGSGVDANSGVDVRQAFFTIGTPETGTLKLGRDYGVFGANAILTDMTLLGAGAPTQATQRGRVTLGHIGAGYTYLGTYGQMTYTSPTFGNGFSFTGALVSPVDAGNYVSKNYPQFQAQLAYTNDVLKAWLGAKTQKFYGAAGTTFDGDNFNEASGELGVSLNLGAFGLLANVEAGKGLGILSDGDQGDIKGVNYLLQGSYKVTDKLKFGLNYGVSKNRDNSAYNDAANGSFKQNENVTGGLYYTLTKSITLAGELGETRSKDYLGNEAKQYGGSVGGIIFF
jgi:predicted porin